MESSELGEGTEAELSTELLKLVKVKLVIIVRFHRDHDHPHYYHHHPGHDCFFSF
jgi:hypothetical protein